MNKSNLKRLLRYWGNRGDEERVSKILIYIEMMGVTFLSPVWEDPCGTGVRSACWNLDNSILIKD